MLVSTSGFAHAGESKLAPDPAAHTVVVPYDVKKPLKDQKPQRYYLNRETFDRLWSLAKENRKPERESEESSLSIHSATYRATVEHERLVLNAKFEIGTRGAWTKASLPVKSGDSTVAVVHDWTLDGKPVSPVEGLLLIEKAGTHVVETVIELKREAGWKKATLSLPAALASFVTLSVPANDGRPALDGVALLTEEQINGQRVFSAVLNRPDSLVITRSPRRPLADAALPAVAETELIIGHTSGGAQSLLGTVRFEFPGTERTRFSLEVDAGWQIAGWEVRQNGGEVAVKHWSVRDANGRRLIEFELDRPVADTASVSIHGTRGGGVGDLRTPVLEPQATKGQQTIALLHDETLRLVPQPTYDQRRIDKPADMHANMSGGRGKTTELFFKLPAKQSLAYTAAIVASKREAHTDYVFQLSEQKQEMMAAVVLKSGRDPWSQLRIALPAEFEIQSVDGPALASWKQEKGDLFLQFNPATSGLEARLLIYLARSATQPQTTWTIEPLGFTGFEKMDGSALIVAHAATEARLVDFKSSTELQEADPTKATDVFGIMPPQEKKRAIKFERGDWKTNVSLAKQPVRFSSDGVVLAQATDVGLLVSQQVAFYVEQGALNRVTVKLPAALPEATVKGDALREVQTRVNGAVREYACSFQSDVLSRAALTFDMELPIAGELSLPFVDVTGAERLRRFFVLDNSSSRESKTIEAKSVETCAKNALPYVPDVLSQPSFYRGSGNGAAGSLKVAYEQLQSTEGNAAIVTLADITSVWRADGERWDTVAYSVFNRSLQFLPVILPNEAELISVIVSGEAVRADQEKAADGRVVRLVPLIQTRAGQRSLEVRLVYRMRAGVSDGSDSSDKSDPCGRLGASLRMDDPELVGISAERTVWTAIVPKKYAIRDIDGNMEEVAEESQVVERLQGLMSDFSRLNKVLALRGNTLSKEEGDYALQEAERISKQIEVETKKVADKNSGKLSVLRQAKKQADDGKEIAQQGQVGKDLGDLQKELGRQQLVLTENRIASPIKGKKAGQTLALGNTWNFNNVAAQTSKEVTEFEGFINYGTPVANQAIGLGENQSNITLNDNTVVRNGFLDQGALTISGANSVAGTADSSGVRISGDVSSVAAVAKAGSGTLVLNSANTYTGNTTLNSGALTLAGGQLKIVDDSRSSVTAANEIGTALAMNAGTPVVVGGGTLSVMGNAELSGRSSLAGGQLGQGSTMSFSGNAVAGVGGLTISGATSSVQPQRGAIVSQGFAGANNTSNLTLNGNARANVLNGANNAAQIGIAGQRGGTQQIGDGLGPPLEKPKADSIDGLISMKSLLRPEDRGAMPPVATPPPPPAAAAPAARESMPSAADPFGAPPPPAPAAAPAEGKPATVIAGREITRAAGAQADFDAPQIPQSFGLEAQVASQLRATGRRSLLIDVPSDGVAYHFRKLKDHAVLELKLRKAWRSEEKSAATWFGIGLAGWLVLSIVCRRRSARTVA